MKNLNLIILSLALIVNVATAQTTTQKTPPATSTITSGKLTTEFTDWAGSEENSASLVNGLRTGTPITLTSTAPDGTPVTSTTFSPPTKPMGYGNVRVALSLARNQLAMQGITNPTNEQLQAALVGSGDSTQGVLQMRASGMGWGQIANSMGVKLGAVMSGKVPAPQATTSTSTTVTHAGSGTTTAAGVSSGTRTGQANKGIVNASGNAASGASAGKSSGVTTASGVPTGGKVTTGSGHAYGQGSSGSANAGNGKGAGKP